MCWYSADHAGKIAEAEAGQRLVTRKVHGCTWAVAESDIETLRPTPVCMVDGTRVLFRFANNEQANFHSAPESEAVFRMLKSPKRDVFQLADGREIEANALPAKLVFDVLEVPGKQQFADILKGGDTAEEVTVGAPKRGSILERVFSLL